ncbi:acyl-CoA 6-desaturase [Patella vulgata]|uniref:acyl-CoA 6-desaturase n=1 Tax=Patella vulgata TaxID=6465 RepID=UPI00217FFE09|nr:acyl-CoA 6-desaturase [Patella vulgata]
MCQEEKRKDKLAEYSWEEIRQHATKTDRWLVIEGIVYDVSIWAKKHPGGERIIGNHAGEDATDAWTAFHADKKMVMKYLRPLMVGRLRPEDDYEADLQKDFRSLRRQVEEMDMFKPSKLFFALTLGQLVVFEMLAVAIFWYFGTGIIPYLLASVFLVTAQAQAGWSQHDFGHLSVFKSSKWNHRIHIFILNVFKGASSSWWNYRHFQHHAKPNIIRKDPDIRLDYLFMVGKTLPIEWGKKKKGFMPYNKQQTYFYFVLPPLLLPIYFNFEIPYFLMKTKNYWEIFWMYSFFARYLLMFYPFVGFWGTFILYFFVRFLESHWFVWTTQMNHIPMEVDKEKGRDWVTMQLAATCNVDPSFFNDWFSGHLNYQIEHHLFPSMPRHNLAKVMPLCKSLCKKHGIEYTSKPLLTAFKDIVGSLKESGELWFEAYNM